MIKTEIKEFKLNTAGHEGLACTLPASVFGTVCSAGILPDPYFGDNARAYAAYSTSDSVFVSEFELDQLSCSMNHSLLLLHRVDTPCTVELNGAELANTVGDGSDVLIDVKNNIQAGLNVLKLTLHPTCEGIGVRDGRLSRLSIGACSILSYNDDIISCVHTRIEICGDFVRLHISVDTYENSGTTRTVATLVSPGGRVFYCGLVNNYGYIDITEPNYWWPSGLGVQNLYKLSVNLYLESEIVDSRDMDIGLVRFESEPAPSHEIPRIFVNGVRLYSRGACYLSDDALLPMLDEGHARALLTDCRGAGFNTVVVRDCPCFPEEHFFNTCDALGLVVWVELNCQMGDEKKKEGLLRSVLLSAYHASFGAIVLTGDGREEFGEYFSDRIAEKVIIQSSDLDSELLPSRASLPKPATVRTFVEGRDANIFSPKMEFHTTLDDNKELISSEIYRYPSGIDEISYVTGMEEAHSLRREIDKVRRERGDVLHTILPRLSDPWGQISQSCIDKRGRWKAQQYLLRSFFAPVRVGAVNDGTRVTFFVSNEQKAVYNGKLSYSVCDASGEVLFRDGFAISVPETSSADILTVDLYEAVEGKEDRCFVVYSISDGFITTSKGTLLFTSPKSFEFKEPNITADISGSGTHFIISISSDTFVHGLEMSFEEFEAEFDDNYIDITDRSPIRIEFTTDKAVAAPVLRRQLTLRSAYDIGRR